MNIARTPHWCQTLKEQFGDILHFLSLTRIDEKFGKWSLTTKQDDKASNYASFISYIHTTRLWLKALVSAVNCYYILQRLT